MKPIRMLSACALMVINATTIATTTSLIQYQHTIISGGIGFSCMNASEDSQNFTGSGGNTFSYMPSRTNCQTPVLNLFLGNEYALLTDYKTPLSMQIGFDYSNFANTSLTGINNVGINPAFTQYNYAYKVSSQQILGDIKLIAKMANHIYPYLDAALGVAINKSHSYRYSTGQTGALNLTPGFDNLTTSKLSFALGLGVDKDISSNFRLGLGYRFSYLNDAPLSDGAIDIAGTKTPVLFNLNTKSAYANQVFARLSYLS